MNDPMLSMALTNVEATARGAVRAAKAGDYGTAALEFSQASMVLGMQIGHQRARLGARYPGSFESKAIDATASRLATSITLAYLKPALTVPALRPEVEEDEPSDDDIEVEEAYGRWGSDEEDE
jgi:hypothetical protein